MSSLRRTFLRNVPASVLEEMRPMMSSSAGTRSNSSTPRAGDTPAGSGGMIGDRNGSLSHHHSVGPAQRIGETVDFSIRDKTDASAKRGFRVQVPKRFIVYMIVFFLVLPLLISGWFLIHAFFLKKHFSEEENKHKLLPDLWSVEDKPVEWEGSMSGTGSSSEAETAVENERLHTDNAEQPGVLLDTAVETTEEETQNLQESPLVEKTDTSTATTIRSAGDNSESVVDTGKKATSDTTQAKADESSPILKSQDAEPKTESSDNVVVSHEEGISETIENKNTASQGMIKPVENEHTGIHSELKHEEIDEVSLPVSKTEVSAVEGKIVGVKTATKVKEGTGRNSNVSLTDEPTVPKKGIPASETADKDAITQEQEEKSPTKRKTRRKTLRGTR